VHLVQHTLDNVERLVSGLLGDSTELAREAEALYEAAQLRAATVSTTVRAAPRFARVLGEVVRLAAAYRLHRVRSPLLDEAEAASALEALHERSAVRLHALCVELRGGLLKIGQLASSRPDLLPAAYIRELSRLQDQVPAAPYEVIAARIEEELGAAPEDLFASFDLEPIAAASLAQVHRAVSHSGESLAVKVQVPGVEDLVEADLAALAIVAGTLEETFPLLPFGTVLDELAPAIRRELDYYEEAASARRFAENFAADPDVLVPGVHPELSSRRVLTMDLAEGARLTDFLDGCAARGEAGAADRDALLALLVRTTCTQVLEHGLFQADPHPGNFLVAPGPRLVLLDFGAVKSYPLEARLAYASLASAIIARRTEEIARHLSALGFETRSGDPAPLLEFSELLLDAFRPAPDRALADLDPRALFEAAVGAARANPLVRIPQEFVLLGRVFGTIGGLLLHHRPRIHLFSLLAPALAKCLAASARPVAL
jgi:ubiquinone biosynthesis protein